MAISTVCKTKRDGTIAIRDLALANSITVAYEAGDFNVAVEGKSVVETLDRGAHVVPPCLRYTDDGNITGGWTAVLRDLSDAAYETLEQILLNAGKVNSDWTSTLGANAEVKTFDILWTIEGSDHGDGADHTMRLKYCVVTGSLSEGDTNTISITFTDYETYPTVT